MITTTTTKTTTVLLQTTIISEYDYHTTAWKLTCIGNLFEKRTQDYGKKSQNKSRLWLHKIAPTFTLS
jgi:hypothetical protein